MSLRVLDPGLHSLIVDAGRPRSRSLGVPKGGAADFASMAIGNALVGNPAEHAALEITLAGPTLQAEKDVACVVHGAPFEVAWSHSPASSKRKRQSICTGKTFTLRSGNTLRIGGTRSRLRAYLCVHGGITSTPILDSRTGLEPLKAGDLVPCQASVTGTRWIEDHHPEHSDAITLRFVDGPQADWFVPDELTRPSFRITPASNRMGLRLSGQALPVQSRELVSEPVCPGAVQVTGDGQCIILGVDGQTIGGYPKIAQVISADLDQVGQLRPGEMVSFRRVTLDEAETAFRDRQKQLQEWLTRLHITWEER
jgi:antagonist of KipI